MRPRKVEDVAEMLRLRIRGRTYEPGGRLPAERELAVDLGVARSTLRAALGELAAEGYLLRRLGAKGGWFVTDLAQPIAEWRAVLKTNVSEMRDMLDYRIGVEARVAELAALRRSDEQLACLEEELERLASVYPPTENGRADRDVAEVLRDVDNRFHELLCEAARSPRLKDAVERARAELFAAETRSTYMEIAGDLLDHHRRIVEAIRDRDTETARQAMEQHIEHGAEVWLAG